MKCPRCGNEMTLDAHRKYDLHMCYSCGYMEGRDYSSELRAKATNYEKLRSMNENEAIAFISHGLGLSDDNLSAWFNGKAM